MSTHTDNERMRLFQTMATISSSLAQIYQLRSAMRSGTESREIDDATHSLETATALMWEWVCSAAGIEDTTVPPETKPLPLSRPTDMADLHLARGRVLEGLANGLEIAAGLLGQGSMNAGRQLAAIMSIIDESTSLIWSQIRPGTECDCMIGQSCDRCKPDAGEPPHQSSPGAKLIELAPRLQATALYPYTLHDDGESGPDGPNFGDKWPDSDGYAEAPDVEEALAHALAIGVQRGRASREYEGTDAQVHAVIWGDHGAILISGAATIIETENDHAS